MVSCMDIVYTGAYILLMVTSSRRISDPSHASPSAEARGTINLRIEIGTRQLIDDAAAALGKTRTEFMVESARRQAVDVLLDRRLFSLDAEHFDSFLRALDSPPAPGPKLRELMNRKKAWQE